MTIELYRLFREEKHRSLDFHLQTFKHFLTLLIAILGATIAGVYNSRESHLIATCILLAGSTLGVIASLAGLKTCDRFYRGMLNAVTVLAKLEPILGLNKRSGGGAQKPNSIPFTGDSALIPEGWKKEKDACKTSKKFVDKSMNKGINRYVRVVFCVFMVLSCISLVYAVFHICSFTL